MKDALFLFLSLDFGPPHEIKEAYTMLSFLLFPSQSKLLIGPISLVFCLCTEDSCYLNFSHWYLRRAYYWFMIDLLVIWIHLLQFDAILSICYFVLLFLRKCLYQLKALIFVLCLPHFCKELEFAFRLCALHSMLATKCLMLWN